MPRKASQEIKAIIKAVNARDVRLRKLKKLSNDWSNSGGNNQGKIQPPDPRR
jgi:hypothetical protein